MANYYSNSQVSLAPYTPSVDINLMNTALQQKQSQYDTNVARIQASIDKASEMDILNPYQKKYLDQKINETTTELNQIGSVDFAANNILNQAKGVASKLYKDPVIQSGLLSTQRIKAQLQDRKRLEKDGKYNDVTRYHDDEEINRYLTSTDLNDYYKGSKEATEWFDAPKALSEAIMAKNPDVEVTINNYGQIERITDKSKTRTPDQIKGLIATEIQNNPQIEKMIGLLGKYNYRGMDKTQLLNSVKNQADAVNQSYSALIKKFEEANIVNNNNVTPNAKVIAQLKAEQQAWNGYTNDNGTFTPGYYDLIKANILNGDLNGAKEALQYQSFIANAVQKYTVNDHDITLDVPEIQKMKYEQGNKDRDYALRYAQFQADEKERKYQHLKDELTLGLKYDKNGKVVVIDDNAPEEGSYTFDKHQANFNTLQGEYNASLGQLRKTWEKVNSNNPEYKNWNKQQKDIMFEVFHRSQETAFTNNYDKSLLDPNYVSWRKNNEGIIQKLNFNKEITDNLTKEAVDLIPRAKGVFTLKNTNNQDINYNYDSPEAEAILNVYNSVIKERESATPFTKYNPNEFINTEISKYRNNPKVYNSLQNAFGNDYNRFEIVGAKVKSKFDEVNNERKNYINNKLKDYGLNLNDRNLLLTNKDRNAEILRAVTSLGEDVLSTYDVTIDKKNSETLGLDAKSIGKDVSGQFYAKIVDAAGKTKKIPLTISNSEKYIPNNPYDYIETQLASRGHTSYDPKNALTTNNGKLSYVIDTDNDGKYISIIAPGGTAVRTEYRESDVAKIKQTLEILSNAVDNTTKQPLTREQIIKSLNNPQSLQTISINVK